MQAGLVLLQRQLHVAVFPADARFAQIVFDGGNEAIQAALEDVIIRTVLHGVDDGFLAQVVREEQERQVRAAVMHEFERRQPAETGRVIAA